MRYAQITPFEVCNGKGAGVSLFTQGCSFHCDGCFNQEAWDFNGGKEWTKEIEDKFFELVKRPYIKRVSILGGEPLSNVNIDNVLSIVEELKFNFPEKKIWLYTGYKWEHIFTTVVTDDFNPERDYAIKCRKRIVELCDVLVDGQFMESLKDLTLKFRGSSNQRVIDVKRSLKEGEIVLFEC
jgi:anaerobic ribonucleoside-triphosphate reductase activating protein